MPIDSSTYTLSNTTPTLVVPNDNQAQEVHLHNMTKSSNEYIHIGGSSVGTAGSIHIDPGQNLVLNLRPGDELYAVSDPNGLELGVFRITKGD